MQSAGSEPLGGLYRAADSVLGQIFFGSGLFTAVDKSVGDRYN